MSIPRGLDRLTAQFELVKEWSIASYHENAIGQCLEVLRLRQLRVKWHRLVLKNESVLSYPSRPQRSDQDLRVELTK